MEIYKLNKSKMISITNKYIFIELQGHCPVNDKHINFRDIFYVKIDLDTDGDNGIQYFHNLTDEKPFLEMGIYDTGFMFVVGFLKSVGEKID